MTKTTVFAGLFCLVLGLSAGSGITYLVLNPKTSSEPSKGDEQNNQKKIEEPIQNPKDVPDPTEAFVKESFQNLLEKAKLDAEILKFSRLDWLRGGNPPNDNPFFYSVAYQGELLFRKDSQIKENFSFLWSEGNTVSGSAAMMSNYEVISPKKGEKKIIRGRIVFYLEHGQWKLSSDTKIDAGQ